MDLREAPLALAGEPTEAVQGRPQLFTVSSKSIMSRTKTVQKHVLNLGY